MKENVKFLEIRKESLKENKIHFWTRLQMLSNQSGISNVILLSDGILSLLFNMVMWHMKPSKWG